jgi:ABC-type multidrug transport system ATPase subunit
VGGGCGFGLVFRGVTYDVYDRDSGRVKTRKEYRKQVGKSSHGVGSQTTLSHTKLRVLDSVSGFVQPGQLVAILGASGSGKSSLLDILAKRPKLGTIGGEIMLAIRQRPLPPPSSASNVPPAAMVDSSDYTPTRVTLNSLAYLAQNDPDTLLATETVLETLTFAALMRTASSGEGESTNHRVNSSKLRSEEPSQAQRRARERVYQLVHKLKLSHVTHSTVGRLSGGEKRRVALGVVLVTNPNVLLCDEVTSALDSKSCEVVLDLLHSYSRQGHCTIVTIHQPSTRVLRRFDALLLMSPGGQQLYFGPTEAAGYGVQRVCRIIGTAAHSFLLQVADENVDSDESEEAADNAARQVQTMMTKGSEGASRFTAAEMLLELAAYSPSSDIVPFSPPPSSRLSAATSASPLRPSAGSFDSELDEEGTGEMYGAASTSLWRSGGEEGELWRGAVRESVLTDGQDIEDKHGEVGGTEGHHANGTANGTKNGTKNGTDLYDFQRMTSIVENVFSSALPEAHGGNDSLDSSSTRSALPLTALPEPHDAPLGGSFRGGKWHGGFYARFSLLCARSCRQWVRDPSLLAAQLGLVIVMAGLIGTFAYHMPKDFTVSDNAVRFCVFECLLVKPPHDTCILSLLLQF